MMADTSAHPVCPQVRVHKSMLSSSIMGGTKEKAGGSSFYFAGGVLGVQLARISLAPPGSMILGTQLTMVVLVVYGFLKIIIHQYGII
jgi:hypothetical protein